MKCYCSRDILLLDHTANSDTIKYECPETHLCVRYLNNKLIGYLIYWDADPFARERYKLVSNAERTVLYKANNNAFYAHFPKYTEVMNIDHFLTLSLKDDQVQVDNLIPRLLRLKAFS